MKNEISKGQMSTSNVVGLVKLSDKFDLDKIYREMDNSSYEPEQFSGLVYRSENPTGTLTLFRSGKAICTGAKTKKDMREIISKLIAKLKFLEITVYKSYNIQVKNMVFTRTLDQTINLAKLALSFGLENIDYEPADFPGLIYKTEEPKCTFILFASGKIICTGAVSNADGEIAFRRLEKKLKHNKII